MSTPVKNLTTNAFDSDDASMNDARSDTASSISVTPRKGTNQFVLLLQNDLLAA